MPYENSWGEEAKERSRRRLEYFKEYARKRKSLGLVTHTKSKSNVIYRYPYKYHGKYSLGYKGEEIALKVLSGSTRIRRPSDLSWEGKKVEVKTAQKQHGDFIQWTTKERKKSSTYRWKFLLTQLRKVDLFFVICEDLNGKVEHIFLIPDKDLDKKYLSISEGRLDKYLKYRISL